MPRDASELARRLARAAEAVCRHYLSKGRRQGRYWTVGDVRNTPGRSMFVRLSGPDSGPGAAGRFIPFPGPSAEEREGQAWTEALTVKKSEFALTLAPGEEKWTIPHYIRDGLVWLAEQDIPPPAIVPPAAGGVA